MQSRVVAIQVLSQVYQKGQSLDVALAEVADHDDSSFIQALCYGVLRDGVKLQAALSAQLKHAFKPKDTDVMLTLMAGAYQLWKMRVKPHAAIFETVEVVKARDKTWAVPLLNAILRKVSQGPDAFFSEFKYKDFDAWSHPQWLGEQIKLSNLKTWREILEANNEPPPMHLRVNVQKGSVESYLEKLNAADIAATPSSFSPVGITLTKPVGVELLPGFEQGEVSVQDVAAQQAVLLLDPQAGDHIADVCAAPGGKTCHIVECAPSATVLALDISETRLMRVKENISRLVPDAAITCQAQDALDASSWPDNHFDKVLLDVPCSALGVIRRHPDIKVLRRLDDTAVLTKTQAALLEAWWPKLKKGGRLMYSTCSILNAENNDQIVAFCQSHKDACTMPVGLSAGQATSHGWQCVPTACGPDGFFYAILEKA